MSPSLGAAAALAVTAMLFTGCASPEAPQSTDAVTSTPTAPPSASVTAESTTPTPDCETMLTAAAFDSLAADNLTSKPFTSQPWDYPIVETVSSQGMMCAWGNSGDVSFVVGELPMDAEQWESTRQDLFAQGFEENEAIATGFLDGPDQDDAGYPYRGVTYRDGLLIYISNGERLGDVEAFTP